VTHCYLLLWSRHYYYQRSLSIISHRLYCFKGSPAC